MFRRISIPLTLLITLFLYRAPSRKITGVTDPDYWWHIEYGRWILEHGILPTTDSWSWTFSDQRYQLTQWLGEVVMGFAYQLAGTTGTGVLAALLITLTVAVSYRTALCYLDNRLAAFVIALFCDSVLLTLVARPHNFTHLALALLSWILASWDNGNRRALFWLPVLFAFWVNFHGGFAFGLTYLGLVCLTLFISAYIKGERPALLPFVAIMLVSALATLLNPYGIGAWSNVLEISNLKSTALDLITEWKATSIKENTGQQFFCVTAALIGALSTARERLPLGKTLALIALMALGWQAVRLSMMVSILMAPFLAQVFKTTPLYDLVFAGEARKYDRDVPLMPVLLVLVIFGSCSWAYAQSDQRSGKLIEQALPIEEVVFIKRHHLNGRILNDMEIGGYLIHHGLPVSIDTRLDLYGDPEFFAFQFARAGRAGWEDYVSRIDPDIVLMKRDAPLAHLLAKHGKYRPVMSGHSFVVLLKNGTHNLPVVALENPHDNFFKRPGSQK